MRYPLAAAALSAALLAIACSKSKQPAQQAKSTPSPTAQPAPSPTPPPSQKDIAAAIRKHGVTPERATQLFSMVLGPLPGVSTPTVQRDSSDFDGTLAVGYLYQVWSSLTPEQRHAPLN